MKYSPQLNNKSGSHKNSARIGPMPTDSALNAAQSNVLQKLEWEIFFDHTVFWK